MKKIPDRKAIFLSGIIHAVVEQKRKKEKTA